MLCSIRHLFLFILLIIIVTSCVSKAPESMLPKGVSDAASKDEKETRLLNTKIITGASTNPVTDNYKIGPGDLLDVKVYEAAELSASVRVNSSGVVTYPLLGEVELSALTAHEAEEELQKLLKAKYMEDPHVSIFIREYRSKQVAVVGAVNRPGTYELLGGKSLLDALAQAGGLSSIAGKLVYLTHRGQDKQLEVDLDELLNKGNTKLNLPVNMGDTVYVPEAGIYYVNGAVNRPGQFLLKKNTTVSEALEIAGGLSSSTLGLRAKLLRYQDGKRVVIPVDVIAIKQGKKEDIPLEDRDVVYVGKNPIIALIQSVSFGWSFWPLPLSVGAVAPR